MGGSGGSERDIEVAMDATEALGATVVAAHSLGA